MLKKYTDMQLTQLEAMHRQVEAHRNKKKSIELRNKWMQAKTVKNYQSEYDRIRGHLANSTTPHLTRDVVVNRKRTLEALGAKAFDTINFKKKLRNYIF